MSDRKVYGIRLKVQGEGSVYKKLYSYLSKESHNEAVKCVFNLIDTSNEHSLNPDEWDL